MSLKSIAEEYFSGINPIAARLCTDMKETQMSYDELWFRLSPDEQQQILTDSIIKPEVLLKYKQCSDSPSSKSQYAVKLIIDDACSYRDEHSGPFSFRTPSQRDLTIFAKTTTKCVEAVKETRPPLVKPVKSFVENTRMPINGYPTLETEDSEEDDAGDALLPKTGLDFLDNW